jgi:hypothetical protein
MDLNIPPGDGIWETRQITSPTLLPRDSVSLDRRAGGPGMRTALVTASVLGLILMAGISARSDQASAQSRGHADFQGYWMGVDPVDGGDARRSLILRSDGKYALAGRDSMLTLCDSTDRGFASFDDGTVVGRNVMESNTLIIKCFNNGATVQSAPQVRAGRARPDARDRDLAGRQPGEHDRAAQGEHELDRKPRVRSQKLRTQCIQSFAFSQAGAIYSN